MKFDERNQKQIKIPPFFISMTTAAKFLTDSDFFLAYLVPLDVDVTLISPCLPRGYVFSGLVTM
jgi:hypothetical protein